MTTPASPNGEQDQNSLSTAADSSVTTPDSQPGTQPSQSTDVSAASSAAPGVKEPTSVLEAVTAALQKQGEPAAPGAKTDGGESPPPAGDKGSQEPGDAKATDGGQQPVKDANTRIRELVAETKALAPKAQHFDQLAGYLRSNNVTQQEFVSAIEARILAKVDPAAAIERLNSEIAELTKLIDPEQLPADIQDRLNVGQIDEDTARELARLRKGNEVRVQRTTEFTQEQQRRESERMVIDLSQKIAQSVTNAEAHLERTDPNYPQIKPYVLAMVQQELDRGQVPQTPEAAVKQLRDCVAKVKKDFGHGPRPTINTPGRQQDTGGNPAPVQPKSAYEAANLALEAMRS